MVSSIPIKYELFSNSFEPEIGTKQVLPLRLRVVVPEVEVMAMKEYSSLLRSQELEPHHHM